MRCEVNRHPQAVVGYALETQTKPIFSNAPSIGTMAHELAHQWYGDSVSLERWSDIWLNEGFATYASWLYAEKTSGMDLTHFFDVWVYQTGKPTSW